MRHQLLLVIEGLLGSVALVGCGINGTVNTTPTKHGNYNISGQVRTRALSPTISIEPISKITASYYPALMTADQFLSNWLTYNAADGVKLPTTHAKEAVPKADTNGVAGSATMYFSNSQPSHQGYEVVGYRQINPNTFEFKVWMYAYAMGVQSFPITRPAGQTLDVIRQGAHWKINNLPRY